MTRLIGLMMGAAALVLAGCQTPASEMASDSDAAASLSAVLAAQPEDVQARYGARNPAETLAFFGIEPGMTVVEALPGRGWYSKILLPYLGEDGTLIGAHYPDDMWIRIIPGATEESIAGYIAFTDGWAGQAEAWAGEAGPDIESYRLTQAPAEASEEVDAALFIRALHNLARVEGDLGHYSAVIAETYRILEPGGLVGVVQHRAPEGAPDDWAAGNAGYMKQSRVIADFEAAGFELVATSEINANPLDTPGPGDVVWRLPPTLATTEEGTPERAAMLAIGESDRMTLLFRKPE